jgi:hypothetical protein
VSFQVCHAGAKASTLASAQINRKVGPLEIGPLKFLIIKIGDWTPTAADRTVLVGSSLDRQKGRPLVSISRGPKKAENMAKYPAWTPIKMV